MKTLCFALLALCASAGCRDPGPPPPASIFVITLDAASALYFGTYGDPHGATPHIDRFASEAVVFDNAYSQSSTTVASTASLLTGVRGTTHLMTGYTMLPPQFTTLPQRLAKLGFRTRAFVANPFAGAHKLGFARGYAERVEVYGLPELEGKRERDGAGLETVSFPQDLNEQLFARLPEMQRERAAGSPLFTYLHFLQPHKPYDPPEPYLRAYGEEPGTWNGLHLTFMGANKKGHATPETIARVEARYRANLRFVDEGIGALLEQLRKVGMYDDSLIVLLADHGDAFFGHKQFGHNTTLYDDMVRIPLMMKFPARDDVEPARIAALVETVDVAPTLLAYAGAPIPPELEGESLLPLIRGEAKALAHPEVVMATQLRDVHAIRDGDFKFILRVPGGEEELYDLRSDPDEQRNLVAAQPERASALRTRLAPFVRADAEAISPDNRLRDDPRMNELLEKLGYLDDRPKK